jgi:penicillin amidase
VPGWNGEHEWDGIVAWERMPHAIDPPGGRIVTANNRVAGEAEDYLCVDAMPPLRARRIWRRLVSLGAASVEDMAAIHRDIETIPGQELRERLRGLATVPAEAVALHRTLLDWDGQMAADSLGAGAYVATRLALTKLVADRSGLSAAMNGPYAKVPPGTNAVNQLWWSIPAWLRDGDVSLLGGATWDELLGAALTEAAAAPLAPWGETHVPKFTHPLSAAFPVASRLDRASAPVGGDNDTVFATGCAASVGARAVYASLSRYVFDVGAWENCRWIVFHGASGEPDSPWHMNQNAAWAAGEMVPMLYDWGRITNEGTERQALFFADGAVRAREPQ